VINGVVALIAAVLLVFVVIALYAQRGDGGGRLRTVAYTVTLAGTVLLAGDYWFEAFIVPYLADVAPTVLGGDPGGIVLGGVVASFIVYGVGWLLLGIASYRDRSLPRAPVILVTAAAVLGAPPESPARSSSASRSSGSGSRCAVTLTPVRLPSSRLTTTKRPTMAESLRQDA